MRLLTLIIMAILLFIVVFAPNREIVWYIQGLIVMLYTGFVYLGLVIEENKN